MNKKLIINILSIFITTIYSHNTFGQIIDNEQAHSSIKWQQIKTQNYRLLFPSTFDSAARNLAKQLPYLRQYSSRDLGKNPHPITLILQGNHLSQNGYVQLAPRKSEFYPVPSSTADNQEWLPNLALHELRHVAQFDKLTGRIRGPFFEQLALALYALNLPAWYFEGDAVQIETIHSAGGRGRLPSWEMPIRANVLSDRDYDFNKYVLGSFKDNVPSHYSIGLLMNTYMTNHTGIESHEKIMEDMRNKLLRPFNFQRAFKHASGMKPRKMFHATMAELEENWVKNDNNKSIENEIKTIKSKFPSDYLLPQRSQNDELWALKSSPHSVNEIIVVDPSGKEHSITKTGIQITPYFHLRGTQVVWDEYRKDPRFGKQTYNVINLYDIKTKALKTLTHRSRYYSPVLHPSQDVIAVVEVDAGNKSSLLLLNAKDGNVLETQHLPEGVHIQQPKFDAAGDKIIAIAVSPKGTNLIEITLATRQHRFLLDWGNQQLERPSYHHDDILFKAHFDGLDNIYRIDQEGELYRLTDARFGAFNAFVDEQKQEIIYNDYRYNGYKLASQKLESGTKTSLTNNNAPHLFIQPTLDQLKDIQQPIIEQQDTIQITAYNPTTHLINFHSLSISSTNFESFDNYIPGLFWLSNDVLNSSQIKLGYEYDPDIRKSIYSAELAYRRYLPVFTARYANRGLVGNAVTQNNQVIMYDYRDHHATFEVGIPLSVYRQNVVYSYGANFGTSYTKRYDVSISLRNFNETIAFPLNYQAYFNRNSMRSRMDLAPRWGQNISITYRHLPFEQQLSGEVLSVRTNFYLPGLSSNHSLQFRFAAQRSNGRYEGVYDIPMVSGWGNFRSDIVSNTALASYRMPLFYPDWSIGSLAYIKRFQGLLFSDFQNIHRSSAPKSFGLGISADLNVFRYVLPDINVAARLTYINDSSASRKLFPTFGFSYAY
ncbi:TolB-like translocation protein [Sphingobacterium bambusae]|uniref:Bacterial surface antigen (D15) domain-containing protein n=1 Tax=Sphingobacterium bambusae TaxID=662858 RepID=A0ABW6BLE9_9SPHI|nr:hypothetical protein [Sphingobacterium bambusae]WPL49973.1 hypothetical protein SCB77_05835 [Sphingobacterium bambusae]